MKKLAFLFILMAGVFSSAIAKDIQKVCFDVQPINAETKCDKSVVDNLLSSDGVCEVIPNCETKKVVVKFDAEKTNPENIVAQFEKLGVKAVVACQPQDCKGNGKMMRAKGKCVKDGAPRQPCDSINGACPIAKCEKAECPKAKCCKAECEKCECGNADCPKCCKAKCEKAECPEAKCCKAECEKCECGNAECPKCCKAKCEKADCPKTKCEKAECKKTECQKN